MKPHPRMRKTIKWGGAVVTVLLVVVWIASCFLTCDVVLGDMVACVGVSSGQIAIDYSPYENDFGEPRFGCHAFEHRWVIPPLFDRAEGGAQWILWVPLWVLTGLALAATAFAWRLDSLARRVRLNLCPTCAYDRAGIATDTKCPECGRLPS
jgi:hypothetical protein